MSKPRKPIADLIEELRSWLPNYDHGPNDFPTVFYRILANAPGAEELEDIGYEPIGNMGWHELDLLGRVLGAIQDKRDVEDLVQGLIRDEEGEVEEARGRRRDGLPIRRPNPERHRGPIPDFLPGYDDDQRRELMRRHPAPPLPATRPTTTRRRPPARKR